MSASLLLWAALAAADPAPAEAPPPAPAEAPPEAPERAEVDGGTVIVWSELQVHEAREAVIQAAKQAGYTQEIRRDDRTILRHGLNYRGDVVVHDDGRIEVKRQPVQFEPYVAGSSPATWLSCILLPLCIRPGGQLVSQRRFRGYQREALAAVTDEAQVYGERVSTLGLGRKLDALPDRLMALWELGLPLDGASHLATPAARKAALLAYWDTRTETDWGEAVRTQVEGFLRAVVQTSEHPITDAELEAFNATRQATRPLVLALPGDG